MTDEEYLFRLTEKERKRIARGDKNKIRQGGRIVRLPSDNLSRKEREALNGPVKIYMKKDFYTWEEFKALPSDLKVAWVNSIINRYGAGVETISEIVFGCSKKNLRNHLTRIGEIQFVNKPLTGKAGQNAKKALAAAFNLWKNTQITMSEEDLPQDDPDPAAIDGNQPEIEALHETTASECEETVAPAPKIAVKQSEPTAVRFDPANIAALIAALAGSGAKLTIEVVL